MTRCSVYIRPQEKEGDKADWIEELEKIRDHNRETRVGGDFNARNPAWGSEKGEARGKAVKEKLETTGWSLFNNPTTLTRLRQSLKERGTTLDLTWQAGNIKSEWSVGPDPWGSDYLPIFANLKVRKCAKRTKFVKWDSFRYTRSKAMRGQDFAERIRNLLMEATTEISVKEDGPASDLHLLNLFANRLRLFNIQKEQHEQKSQTATQRGCHKS